MRIFSILQTIWRSSSSTVASPCSPWKQNNFPKRKNKFVSYLELFLLQICPQKASYICFFGEFLRFPPCLGYWSWIFSGRGGGGGGGRVESSSLRFTLPMWEIHVGRRGGGRGGWLSPLRHEKSPKFLRTFAIFPKSFANWHDCILKGENIHSIKINFEEMSVNLIPARRYDAPRWQKKATEGFLYFAGRRRRRGLSAHSGGVMRTCKRGKVCMWWVTLEEKYFQMEMGKVFFLHDLTLPSSQKVLSRLWANVEKPKSSGEIF